MQHDWSPPLLGSFNIKSVYCRSVLNTKYFYFWFSKSPVKMIVSHIFFLIVHTHKQLSSLSRYTETEKNPNDFLFQSRYQKLILCISLLCIQRKFQSTCNYIKTEDQTCICLMFNIKFPRSELHKKSDWISAVLYNESKPSI